MIAIAVITTQKYRDRLNAIKNSWGKNVTSQDLVYISDEECLEHNIIKVTGDSSYASNPIKVYGAIKYFYNHKNNYDWFIIVDDDTFVNYKNLIKYIKTQSLEDIEMMGYINKFTSTCDDKLCYISGGAGHLFNNKTLQVLKNMTTNDLVSTHADVCLGLFCKSNNISIIFNSLQHPGDLKNIHNNSRYDKKLWICATTEEILNAITFHYMAPNCMTCLNYILTIFNKNNE